MQYIYVYDTGACFEVSSFRLNNINHLEQKFFFLNSKLLEKQFYRLASFYDTQVIN